MLSFAVINAGVAGCCTGLALSFPGTPMSAKAGLKMHISTFSLYISRVILVPWLWMLILLQFLVPDAVEPPRELKSHGK